jgi:hypothetical protein
MADPWFKEIKYGLRPLGALDRVVSKHEPARRSRLSKNVSLQPRRTFGPAIECTPSRFPMVGGNSQSGDVICVCGI